MRSWAVYRTFRQLAPFKRCHTPLLSTKAAVSAGSSACSCCSSMSWHSLEANPAELTLDCTLPTGQSFRWRRTAENEFTGVVDSRVVKLQQLDADVQYQIIARGEGADAADDAAVLRDYFNLNACLKDLSREWSQRDQRFNSIHQYFPGARVLRQDPVECLFEFICSSNNHISRIHGMVERLCRDYGTPLLQALPGSNGQPLEDKWESAPEGDQPAVPDLAFYAFPTLDQLSKASEAALRAEGFGYRAKFITGSVAMLLAKPGGGREWLLNLRTVPYRDASEALCKLPGIGPKVAACVCLFALDKHEAIPVDTHVWQLAVRYYTPHLKGKTMNKKIMLAVEDAFIDKFGPWAGWAHNTLFISELASQQDRLPEHLRPRLPGKASKAKKTAKSVGSDAMIEDQIQSGSLKSSRSRKPATSGDPADPLRADPEPAAGRAKRLRKTAEALDGVMKAESQAAVSEAAEPGFKVVEAAKKPETSSKAGSKANTVRLEQQQTVASKRLGKRTRSSALAAEAAVDQAVQDAATTLEHK